MINMVLNSQSKAINSTSYTTRETERVQLNLTTGTKLQENLTQILTLRLYEQYRQKVALSKKPSESYLSLFEAETVN